MINRIKADATALAAAQAGEWQQCADRLNAIATPVRKPESVARKTWVGLQALFGVQKAATWKATILGAIKQAEAANDLGTAAMLSLFDQSLGGVGYDFGDPQTQSQLESLGGAGLLASGDVASLKAVGAEKPVVTAQDCLDAWASENRASFDAWFNEFVSPVLHDKTAAKAAITANLGEW